jgi:hypothetical protein
VLTEGERGVKTGVQKILKKREAVKKWECEVMLIVMARLLLKMYGRKPMCEGLSQGP